LFINKKRIKESFYKIDMIALRNQQVEKWLFVDFFNRRKWV
jgi:hypothetical protein